MDAFLDQNLKSFLAKYLKVRVVVTLITSNQPFTMMQIFNWACKMKTLQDYPESSSEASACNHHKGHKKTSFDVNFISQTITANNLRLRLDDIQELLPSFFPVLVSVGSVSVEFSLSLSRPLKARINDVFILLRANPTSATEHSPEELREVFNSRVLTFSLLRGEIIADDNDNEGCSSTTSSSVHSSSSYFDIGLKLEAIDKLQQSEVSSSSCPKV